MKDFDELLRHRKNTPRDFTMRGQQFRIKASVRPEILTEYGNWMLGLIEPPPTEEQSLRIMHNMILAWLEPEFHSAWEQIRAREDDEAVSLNDLLALREWIAEVSMGRPTSPSSASGGGDGNHATGTPSTDALPSSAAPN